MSNRETPLVSSTSSRHGAEFTAHPTPDAWQRWSIDAACKDTIARAAWLTDQNAHEAFAALFTEDATLQRPTGPLLAGRAAILAAYQARPLDRLSFHLLVGTVVDVTSVQLATAKTRVLLYRGSSADVPGPDGLVAHAPAKIGLFDDLLVPDAMGRWLISERRASFDLVIGGGS